MIKTTVKIYNNILLLGEKYKEMRTDTSILKFFTHPKWKKMTP